MKHTDKVYGDFDIKEAVILELIQDRSLERLKGIDQCGYWKPHFPNAIHTRFEHSLGAYYLLKKYGASIEEQIAGLIHDVSHSVFSHCVDYVLKTGEEHKQNHQDSIFVDFVKETNIPNILEKYGFDLEYILDDTHFPLQEKELPDLCADRIDYSLRTAVMHKEITQADVNWYLEHLTVDNNEWVFKNLKSAKKYAELFCALNKKYYTGLPSAIMFRTVGDCIGYALQKEYLVVDDLYTVDNEVLKKLQPFLQTDPTLNHLFLKMNKQFDVNDDPTNYSSQVVCKSRVVDPLFFHPDGKQKLSLQDPVWRKIVTTESQPKKYFLSFET